MITTFSCFLTSSFEVVKYYVWSQSICVNFFFKIQSYFFDSFKGRFRFISVLLHTDVIYNMYMKKILSIMLIVLVAQVVTAQSYKELWQQVQDAQQKDLPKTERQILAKIQQKARRESNYGQLLKSTLADGRVAVAVSPDSLLPLVKRLQFAEQRASNPVLKAVYNAVLYRVYRDNESRLDDAAAHAAACRERALTSPDKLASVKTTDYEPLVVNGADSRLLGNDMLSVIGYETQQFEVLNRYYRTTNNRTAQLLTAVEMVRNQIDWNVRLQRIDSLIASYGDLDACCEAAIERLYCMETLQNYTVAQRVAFIDEALQRWGGWRRSGLLRNERNRLTQVKYRGLLNDIVTIPGREQPLTFSELRGISGMTVRLYKVKSDGMITLDPTDADDYKKLKPLLTPLPQYTLSRHYSGHAEYEQFADSVILPPLPVGVYMVETVSEPTTQVSRSLYFVSNLRVLAQALPDNRMRYAVVNATTGQPVAGATVQLSNRYERSNGNGKVETLTTDAKGEVICENRNSRGIIVHVMTKDDRYCPKTDVYGNYYTSSSRDTEQWALFTDRSIYRPGQTVRLAAFLYQVKNGFEHQVCAGREVKAVLRDANNKVVEEKMLTADDYGTVSTEFLLPAAGLTGRYSVSVGSQRQSIRVEEYKRPTFQVELRQPDQDYQAGDTLSVSGMATTYAGVPVQGGRVSYRVVRRAAFWWYTYRQYWADGSEADYGSDDVVSEGEARCAEDGTFQLAVPMTMPAGLIHPMFFNYVITADVTDAAGETHHGELSLPLGNRKHVLTAEMPDKILKEESSSVTFHLRNAAGTDLVADVRYRIDNGSWQTVSANVAVQLPVLSSGRYQLEAVCKGDTVKRTFVVFSIADKRPVVETKDWFYVSANQFANDGTPVTIQAGASGANVHIFYTIIADNKIIEQGAVDKTDALLNRQFTYQEQYGSGLSLSFAWVRDGKIYQHHTTIRRPLPDKQLKLQWQTFRDRLIPGQQEEWTLTVQQPDGTPANAQMMATLYDKGLDQLVAHQWTFAPFISLPLPTLSWTFGRWWGSSFFGYKNISYIEVPLLSFSHFDSDCFPLYWRRMYNTRGNVRMMKTAAFRSDAIGSMEMAAPEAADEAKSVAIGAMPDAAPDQQVDVRDDLQENAFFYPNLMTDADGRVSLKFTLPESLTTWRFLGLAHTKDMMYGSLEGEAIAQKDVMIQPNVPRFLRQGDEAALTARVVNTCDQVVCATVWLQLINPATDHLVYGASQPVTLEAGSTAAVTFDLADTVLPGTLLICRMTVSGDGFSDGEQHYLPILPSREMVTVTVPFTQTVPGEKRIDLNALFPDSAITMPKLTVEYTNNPAWLMIQSLPSIGHPHDNCAVCQAASYYANTLGRHLLQQAPQIKQVLESWKHEQGSETSLMSDLEKNQELRELVLSETPWVADADKESEQKQRLADFFDENLMQQRLTDALTQLKTLQNANGSWSWWPGMDGSLHMTVWVSELLTRLGKMTGASQEVSAMLALARQYMDGEMQQLVSRMKAEERKGHRQSFPGKTALQYLYIYALDGRMPSATAEQTQRYLKQLLKRESKNLSIYDKAMASVVLKSGDYVKSLIEWSSYKEGMGRYYDTPRAGYSWQDYRIPTQVAVIEALQQLMPSDKKTIRELQEWLLQEKRTQAWDTPINSVDAIYAFLGANMNHLDLSRQTATIAVDGSQLAAGNATAGLGYVKVAQPYRGERTLTVSKSDDETSWGAVYAQFIQPTKDIVAMGSDITVKREFTPISGATGLRVGDRVKVRITIEAARDLDFVQVVDKRAACMEPVQQLSVYRNGCYVTPRDHATNYYFDQMSKGKHIIETEYYIDRAGSYETGTCTVQCAYAPAFRGTCPSQTISVTE